MANPEHIKWLLEGVDSWNARRQQEEFTPDFESANIFECFQQAGELDKNGYIPLAEFDLSGANFRKAHLTNPNMTFGTDFRGANLWSADFGDAQLANSLLDGASLPGARFEDASMHGASLSGPKTKMASTNFSGADLSQADFSNTDAANANFTNADLCWAELTGADLRNAVLTGADISYSKPWEAILFEDSNGASGGHHNKRVRSVAELIEECRQVAADNPGHTLYFRGEQDKSWPLQPSVMRRTSRGNKFTLRDKEGEMLIDLMSRRPEEFANGASALSQWVLAQHHGLKTRLLDVTRNPLVGLFWACVAQTDGNNKHGRLHVFSVPRKLVKPFNSDTVSVLANFAKLSLGEQNAILGMSWNKLENQGHCIDEMEERTNRAAMDALYQMIREEKPHFRKEIDPRIFFRVFVVEPQQSFQRIRAQSGAFLISAFHERFERKEVLGWNSVIPIYEHSTLAVPLKNRPDILDELRLTNITPESLSPGLDQAAKTITESHSK